MFTGIIEETGIWQQSRINGNSAVVSVQADKVLEGTRQGDSIAVNGVCLTVTRIGSGLFEADVMPETLRRTNLGSLSFGHRVNLERAMAADGRFGGHIVAGHVDGTGRIRDIRIEDNAVWYEITASDAILRYIVEKGSVTLDGISLTVASLGQDYFRVSVIPHTREVTALTERKTGDRVNIENDIVGKYVERFLTLGAGDKKTEGSRLSMEFLGENGFL